MPPTDLSAALFMTTSVPEAAVASGAPTAATDAESGGAEAFAALLEQYRKDLNKAPEPIELNDSANDRAVVVALNGLQAALPDAESPQRGLDLSSATLEGPELSGAEAASDGPAPPIALWTLAPPSGNALPQERQSPGPTPDAEGLDDAPGIGVSAPPFAPPPFPLAAAVAAPPAGASGVGAVGRASAAVDVAAVSGDGTRSSPQGLAVPAPPSPVLQGGASPLSEVVDSGAAGEAASGSPRQRAAPGEPAAAAQLSGAVATEGATPEAMRRTEFPGMGLPGAPAFPADAVFAEHGERGTAVPQTSWRTGLQGLADASVSSDEAPAAVAPPRPSVGVQPGALNPAPAAPAANLDPAGSLAPPALPAAATRLDPATHADGAESPASMTAPVATALLRSGGGHAHTSRTVSEAAAGLPRPAMVPGAGPVGLAVQGATTDTPPFLPAVRDAAPREPAALPGVMTPQGVPMAQGVSGAMSGPGAAQAEGAIVDPAMGGMDPLPPVSTPAVPLPGTGLEARAPLPRSPETQTNGATGQLPMPGVVEASVPVPGDLPPGSAARDPLAAVGDALSPSELSRAIGSREHPTPAGVVAPMPPAGGRSIEAPVTPAPPGMPLPMLLASANGTLGSELGEKILWLSGHNLRGAEIQLDPPELGPLQIQIHNHRDGTSVQFTTHTAVARDAVESHLGRLRELLEGSGLSLLDVNVSQQQRQGQRQPEANAAPMPALRDRLATAGEVLAEAPRRRPSGLVDAYA